MMNVKELINKAKLAGISDIEVYQSITDSTSISIFNGEVDKSTINSSNVYSIRAIYNDKMSAYSFENQEANLDEIIEKLKENAKAITATEEVEIFGGSEKYETIEREDGKFKEHTIAEKVALAKEVEKVAKSLDTRIVLVNYCVYEEEKNTVKIINSKGLDLEKKAEYGVLVLGVVSKDETPNPQNGFEVKVVLNYDELDPEKIAKEAVKQAVSMLGAAPCESKTYPVIIENKAMASLLGGFDSIFTGEALLNKVTPLAGKEGTKIMQDCVNILDAPLDKTAVTAQPFDDEGVACYNKAIVENGVFKTFMHNLKTAKKFNTTSTANGVKAGDRITTGSYNLFIEKGEKTKEELIASLDEGLLIDDLSGLHAGLNPISCDFSAQSSGYLIKNGKIERPVTLIVVSGNFLKMMNDIEAIGSDLYLGYNGTGAPSILFKGLPVSGK